MKIEGAIFDLDGTLLDSMSIWDTVGEDYLLSLGIAPRENLAETFKDMSLSQSAAYYQAEYGVDKTEQEIIDGINAIIEQFYLEKAPLKDGVKENIERLAEKGVKMCIATATDRHLVEGALMRCEIREYFTEIFTCREAGCGKNEPVIYEMALHSLGTKKESTIVFEDAIHAVKTAKKAGFVVVGVYDESEKNQKEVREQSDYYIENFHDFIF